MELLTIDHHPIISEKLDRTKTYLVFTLLTSSVPNLQQYFQSLISFFQEQHCHIIIGMLTTDDNSIQFFLPDHIEWKTHFSTLFLKSNLICVFDDQHLLENEFKWASEHKIPCLLWHNST